MSKSQGHIFQRGKCGNWYIQYQHNGKKRVVRLLDAEGAPVLDRKGAEEAAERLLVRVNESNKAERAKLLMADLREASEAARLAELSEHNERCTINDAWKMLLECRSRPKCLRFLRPGDDIPKHSSACNYHSYWRVFAEWAEGRGLRHLSEVSADDANLFMDSLKCSSGTYNKYRMFFVMLYQVLNHEGKLSCENPFAKVFPQESDSRSKEPLGPEQVSALIGAAEGEVKVLFMLGYYTGLRMGDCCTLRWVEVKPARGVIERLPNKTGRRSRDKSQAIVKVGIAPALLEVLEALPRNGEYVLPGLAKMYLAKKEYLVTNRVNRVFEQCGIATRVEGTGGRYGYDENGNRIYIKGECRAIVRYGFHSLRYSYISHNAEAGTPMGIIQRNAGHASRMMTEHYLKISDAAARQYADALKLPEKKEDGAGESCRKPCVALRERLLDMCRQLPDDKLELAISILGEITES